MLAKTFIITEPTVTGLQTYSGIGFQGKLVLINAMSRAGAATGAGASWMFGAAVSSTKRWVQCGRSDDNAAAGNAGSRRNTTACIVVSNVAGTAACIADFDSWTSDGFKLDWTTVSASQRKFIVTVLGGTDFDADVGQSTTPASTGNQSISSLSFQPTALIIADCRLNNVDTGTSTYWRPSIGFFDEAGNGAGWGGNTWDAFDPTVTSRVQSTSGYVATATDSGAIDRRCTLVSYNANGFTLNWTTLDASFGASTDYQWIAIRCPSAVQGEVAARTTTGNTTISGLGHTPQLILIGGAETTLTNGGSAGSNMGVGMVGGTGATEQAVASFEDQDNVATSNASSKWAEGKAINFITANGATPTDDIVASVTNIDYGEFTLNYTTVSGTAVQVIYLSLGTELVTNSSSFTLNSIVKANRSSSITLNAIVKAKITSTKTLDAIVKKKISASATLNAIVKQRESVIEFGRIEVTFAPQVFFGVDGAMAAQQFTAPITGVIDLVKTLIGKGGGSPTGTVEVALQADASAEPSGTDLAVASFPASSVSASLSAVDAYCHFPVVSGQSYWLVWRSAGNVTSDSYELNALPWPGPEAGSGAEFDGATWTMLPFARNIFAFVYLVFSTFSINAIVKVNRSSSLTLNGIVKAKITQTATLDAVVKAGLSASFTLNAVVKLVGTGSFSIDADVRLAGRAIWTTPITGINIVSTPTLAFLMPAAVGDMFFQIELDLVNTFDSGDLIVYDSSTDQTGWEYWNGSAWTPVPGTGVPNSFSGNEARLTLPVALDPGHWYRRVRAGV